MCILKYVGALLRYQGMHHQFVASALCVKYAHEHYPELKMGNMMIYAPMYPLTPNPDDILLSQEESRRFNYFCSDVQVRGEYPGHIKRYFAEHDIEVKMEPGDEEILREGTVDFYTFSYYMSNCVSADPAQAGNVTAGNVLGGVKNLPISRRAIGAGRSIHRACVGRSTRSGTAISSR